MDKRNFTKAHDYIERDSVNSKKIGTSTFINRSNTLFVMRLTTKGEHLLLRWHIADAPCIGIKRKDYSEAIKYFNITL